MKLIKLSNGGSAIVDDSDFKFLNQFYWHENKIKGKQGYVRRAVYNSSNHKTSHRYMHHDIFGCKNVDHKNGNRFDNRKGNLRRATKIQNGQNQRLKTNNTSGFKGVHRVSRTGKFVAYIRVNKKRKHLGTFSKCKDAASAYDSEAVKRFGKFALTNKMLGLI